MAWSYEYDMCKSLFMHRRFSILNFFYLCDVCFCYNEVFFEGFTTLQRLNANFFIRFKVLSVWMSGTVLFVFLMLFVSFILFILLPSLLWFWTSIWIIAKIPELSEDKSSELDEPFFCFLWSFYFFLCFLLFLFLFFFIFLFFLID
jgi:hypothetical protein